MIHKSLTSLLVFMMAFAAVFAVTSSSYAQSVKPKLVEIVLNDRTSSPEAKKIISTFVEAELNKSGSIEKIGSFEAKFIPISGSQNRKFIYASFYDAPIGGCYASGCLTVIYMNKPGNNWVPVFSAFIKRSFYDINSQHERPANLIMSSDASASTPGIWMWDGIGYKLVNKK